MNKKDFCYLVIITGLVAFIIIDQKTSSLAGTSQPKQPGLSKPETGVSPDEYENTRKNKISESIESTAQKTKTNKYSASPDSEIHKNSDLPKPSDKPENKKTTADTHAALQHHSDLVANRFNKQRENQFKQAPPDAWGDDMKNEVETLYYTNINQSDIESFDAECKAKMCNIDLVLDENSNKATFSNISSNIFPSYPRNSTFVITEISDNTITIKADFDEPININDN